MGDYFKYVFPIFAELRRNVLFAHDSFGVKIEINLVRLREPFFNVHYYVDLRMIVAFFF